MTMATAEITYLLQAISLHICRTLTLLCDNISALYMRVSILYIEHEQNLLNLTIILSTKR